VARRRAAVGCPVSQYCDSRANTSLSPQALEKEEGRAVSGSEAVSVQLVSPTGAAAAVPVELVDGGTRFRCVSLKHASLACFRARARQAVKQCSVCC